MKKLRITNYELRIKKILLPSVFICVHLWLIFLFSLGCFAQSISQSYPTAISSNEISGKIAARDIGDARLTTYYYVFNGNQGDIFINVVTNNLDGDIDIFTVNNLKPLTKIKIYSDSPDGETGRIVYLRQPERLILRIEGRTPNDDAATFRIKFAGSFAPVTDVAETEEPKLPEIKTETQTDVQVNSVGTIVAIKPKPTPSPKDITVKADDKDETVAEREDTKIENPAKADADIKQEITDEKEIADKKAVEDKEIEKPEVEKKDETKETTAPIVVITDNLPKKDETKTDNNAAKEESKENTSTNKTTSKPKKKPIKKSSEPNPLASINLVVLFKDGTKIERPMSEVLRVSVDKGVLTVISKDGSVGRYSILDITEMTIK